MSSKKKHFRGYDHRYISKTKKTESGADFLVTSVGAFTDTALFDRLLAAAKASGTRLILPSAGRESLSVMTCRWMCAASGSTTRQM